MQNQELNNLILSEFKKSGIREGLWIKFQQACVKSFELGSQKKERGTVVKKLRR